jgi:anhydro-N-acetylmuramic acid kinase
MCSLREIGMLEYMFSAVRDYTHKEIHTVVGLMSGTSLDGIDAACVEITGSGESIEVQLRGFICVPFEELVREHILRLCADGPVVEVARLNFLLGELFADAALRVLESCNVQPRDVDLIGSHGQTVCHLPAEGVTLQIGEPSIIAERTGITTVADFRPRDMATGGQGAPLVPLFDYLVLRHHEHNRIVQNIGGIANLTWLPAGGLITNVQAWDTGPGNMIIDECMRLLTGGEKNFDKNGQLAKQGRVDGQWLQQLMQHPYFEQEPPKTAGREEFGAAYTTEFVRDGKARGLNEADIVATATALTAESVAASYRVLSTQTGAGPERVTEVVLGGGGAFNGTLRQMLAERIPHKVLTLEDVGIRSDAKEAMAFAVLAHEAFLGHATNVPGATGASRPVVMGKIVPGVGWH